MERYGVADWNSHAVFHLLARYLLRSIFSALPFCGRMTEKQVHLQSLKILRYPSAVTGRIVDGGFPSLHFRRKGLEGGVPRCR